MLLLSISFIYTELPNQAPNGDFEEGEIGGLPKQWAVGRALIHESSATHRLSLQEEDDLVNGDEPCSEA